MTSDKNGNYTEAYTYGLDRISADNLTADSKDNPLYYLYDGRGSVGQLINSSGEIKNSYSYDPFGVTDHDGPLGNSKAHYQDYFGFNGEEYNNISGLQYLRARYYEADSGRFLTRDSYMGNIMNPLSLNRYDYALNNPVMNIDPSGHRALAVDEDGVAAITQRYGTLRNSSSDNTKSDVSLLQTMLNTAGFNPGTIDGIFGNNTEKAVRAYQTSKGLTVDGIVGKQTWRSLGGKVTASSTASNSNELPMLRKGSSNKDAIKKLQLALIDQHYDLGPSGADGIFGNKTVQAVLNFQWDKNLTVDGIVGSQTWEALLGQGKACDGKDYIGSQETGNAGHSTQSTNNNTASADEIITIMSNRGYPITYTRGQWEVAGEIIAAGAVIEMIASITDLYVAGGLAALKDKLLSIFNSGISNAFENVISNAKAAQIKGDYLTDEFTGAILKKGTKIYGLTPGQTAWYTTEDMVNASGYSYKNLYDGLQIEPDKFLGYRQFITEYEVTEDVVVATGKALANITKGGGGYTQYFIDNFKNVLKPIKEVILHE